MKTKKTQTTAALSKDEALAKVAEVLEEALQEYEMLEKMDIQAIEDPSRPMKKDEPNFMAKPEDSSEDESEDEDESEEKDEDEDKDSEDESEESEEEKKKKEMEPKDEEMSDDTMKSEYAALTAKMESRGLLSKSEPKAKELKKSEDSSDQLKKAVDTQGSEISELKKAIASIAETVNKIAAQPAARKGVSGLTPLKKSEGSENDQPLVKSQVVEKLFELKKSGDRRVDTALINRVETNRVTAQDINFIKTLV